jgi:hypothetical protein
MAMNESISDVTSSSFMCSQSTHQHQTNVFQFKTYQVFRSVGALLCFSLSIAGSFNVQPGAAVPLMAQAPNSSAPICRADGQQTEEASLDATMVQAEQAIANGQVDGASQLLVGVLQQIRVMPSSSTKINLLERLVGSFGGNVAHNSPLEQLVQAVPDGRPQAAIAVLSSAFETTQTVSTSYSASKARTFTALANYYARLGQPEQSNRILGEAVIASNAIQGAEFQINALTGFVNAYINAGQLEVAAPILDRSLQLAQTFNHPNPYRKAGILEQIASLYIRLDQPDRALQVVRSIQVPNYQPSVALPLINQYSEAGQIDRALEVMQMLQQADLKALALATIAGRSTAQQPQQADQFYTQAVTTARSAQSADEVIANVVSRYVETGGLVATADETIQAINNPVVKAPALGAIALSYARIGQENLSEARLGQAIETLSAIPEESSRNSVRQQLIDRVIQNGRYDYALRIAQTIQPGEEIPSDRADVLAQLAERAIADNRYDAALQITEQIPSNFANQRDRLFLQIVRGLLQAGEFDRALAIAQQQSLDLSFQPRLLAVIAAQAQLSGQSEQSATLFNQATQLANQIEDTFTRIDAWGAIAQAYLTAEQPEQAAQLLNQILTAAEVIENISTRSFALRTLAEQLTFANQHRAAIQVAEAIPEDSERVAKLNEAIEKAINAGDFTIALATLDRLDNPVIKTRWFIAIADRYIQLREPTQAATVLNRALQTARTVPGNESQTIDVRGGENPLVVDDDQDRGSFLTAIALRYAQIGQISQAQQIAQTLGDRTIRQQLIQQINCYR